MDYVLNLRQGFASTFFIEDVGSCSDDCDLKSMSVAFLRTLQCKSPFDYIALHFFSQVPLGCPEYSVGTVFSHYFRALMSVPTPR